MSANLQTTQAGGTYELVLSNGQILIVQGVLDTGGAGLTSFNGRAAPNVVPTAGDYTAAQVSSTAGNVQSDINALATLNAVGNSGATPSIPIASGNLITTTLNANCVMTLTGLPAGKPWWGQINAKQDVGGGRTLSIVGAITPGGLGLTLSSAPSKTDIVSLSWDGTTLSAQVGGLAFA